MRRLAAVGGMAALVLMLAWAVGLPLARNAHLVNLQQAALGQRAPADYVVYREWRNPAEPDGTGVASVSNPPDLWRPFVLKTELPNWYLVYVGHRHNPAGEPRIVVVAVDHSLRPAGPGGGLLLNARVGVAAPGTLRREPVLVGPVASPIVPLWHNPRASLVINGGKSDPNDPTRFSIELRVDGQPMAVDCRVLPDDSVLLSPRSIVVP